MTREAPRVEYTGAFRISQRNMGHHHFLEEFETLDDPITFIKRLYPFDIRGRIEYFTLLLKSNIQHRVLVI